MIKRFVKKGPVEPKVIAVAKFCPTGRGAALDTTKQRRIPAEQTSVGAAKAGVKDIILLENLLNQIERCPD